MMKSLLRRKSLLVTTVVLMVMAGCGEKSTDSEEADTQQELSEIALYEEKLQQGNMEISDYVALGTLYGEENQSLLQRDTWEVAQQLSYDSSLQDKLGGIVTEVSDNSETIQEYISVVAEQLENGATDAVITQMVTEDWYHVLLPDLLIGTRNYQWSVDGQIRGKCMVQSDEYGDKYSTLWYVGNDGTAVCLKVEPDRWRVWTSEYDGTNYAGSFLIETLDLTTGSIYRDAGDSSNGYCSGAFTESISIGNAKVEDATGYWNGRMGLSYVDYTGSFDENGHTLIEQNEQVTFLEEVMYAVYSSDAGTAYVSIPLTEGMTAEGMQFTPVDFGMIDELIW